MQRIEEKAEGSVHGNQFLKTQYIKATKQMQNVRNHSTEKSYGRIEIRTAFVTFEIDWAVQKEE